MWNLKPPRYTLLKFCSFVFYIYFYDPVEGFFCLFVFLSKSIRSVSRCKVSFFFFFFSFFDKLGFHLFQHHFLKGKLLFIELFLLLHQRLVRYMCVALFLVSQFVPVNNLSFLSLAPYRSDVVILQ